MDNVINYLWLDGETTGLNPLQNDIIQLACIPVIMGQVHNTAFNEYCQPINWASIDDDALKINSISRDQLSSFQKPEIMVDHLVSYLRQFNTKFTIAGFNVGFDKDFIAALFKKVKRERDYLELFTQDIRDTYKRAKKLKNQLPTTNLKLQTLCNHFNITINAHDALSDISATIKLDKILSDMLGETEVFITEKYEMLHVEFAEPAQLHVHSMFSHTDSINSVAELADYCDKNNIPGFSPVDHGNAASLYDIVRLKSKTTGVPGVGLFINHNDSNFYLNGWATSLKGYRNLIKLASLGWSSRIEDSSVEFPLITLEQVLQYKEDIIFGIPGINGPIKHLLLSRQNDSALQLLQHLNSILDIRLELAAINVHKYFDSSIGFCG